MPTKPSADALRVYTTRPDTLFGATYMVIAPEHDLVEKLTTAAQRAAVDTYRQAASFKSDRERTEGDRKKTGVFTGAYAINPVTQQPIPIWIADYVLASYGTGAIMAVPAHDDRDWEFAKQFELPIVMVVDQEIPLPRTSAPKSWRAKFVLPIMVQRLTPFIHRHANCAVQAEDHRAIGGSRLGREAVNYKLRDWLFSRQRFWGEPFPILHELDAEGKPTGAIRGVDISELPVDLPHLKITNLTVAQNRRWPKRPMNGCTSSATASVIAARPTRCRNGLAHAGTSCVSSIHAHSQVFCDPVKEKAGCPSTCMSACRACRIAFVVFAILA